MEREHSLKTLTRKCENVYIFMEKRTHNMNATGIPMELTMEGEKQKRIRPRIQQGGGSRTFMRTTHAHKGRFRKLLRCTCTSAEAATCTKELPCYATECFETMGQDSPVCSSNQPTEKCSVSQLSITMKCDLYLTCYCNENSFKLECDDGCIKGTSAKDQSSSNGNAKDQSSSNGTSAKDQSGSFVAAVVVLLLLLGLHTAS